MYAVSRAWWACDGKLVPLFEFAVGGRGVRVAAGVVGESGAAESCEARWRSVVIKEASDKECTLTRDSDADDTRSSEDLRWR